MDNSSKPESTSTSLLYYMAPLEGVTNYAYRNIHHQVFGAMDRYFTPFIVPAKERSLRNKEKKDVIPENNQGLPVIPQILTDKAELFVALAADLEQLGYPEVNLNIGCPSGTVTGKGRGSAMLRDPEALDRYFDHIFTYCPVRIGVKTRIGVESPEEFGRILEVLNQYPMSELIIHPRIMRDQYQNHPRMEQFAMAYESCQVPLIYNGDLFTVEAVKRMEESYPKLAGIMLGRGLISNPGLRRSLEGEAMTASELRKFHDLVYREQIEALGGEGTAMRHMKEMWFYMIHCFREPDEYWRKLRKIRDVGEYRLWVNRLFAEGEFDLTQGFQPPIRG